MEEIVPNSTQIVSDSTETEVIVNSSVSKQVPSRKNHFITWFYENINQLEPVLANCKKLCYKGTYQTEICPETKRPHIHFMLWGREKFRDTALKIPKKDKIEQYRAFVLLDEKNKSNYANKDDPSFDGIARGAWGFPVPLRVITELRPFQKTIENMCLLDPDDRTINILIDPKTKIGKTQFTKYMVVKHNAIAFTGGEASDIACQLAMEIENGRDLNERTIMIFNYGENKKINKKPLENVKDGLMTSPKYKTSTMVFNSPHIWVFCNDIGDEIPNSKRKDVFKLWSVNEKYELIPLCITD